MIFESACARSHAWLFCFTRFAKRLSKQKRFRESQLSSNNGNPKNTKG